MRYIELTKNQITVVDDIDSDLSDYKWYAMERRNLYYAVRTVYIPRKHTILMSRLIAERVFGHTELQVDHADGDSLNNVRSNLRLATHSQNQMNKVYSNSTGHKGIAYQPEYSKPYKVRIQANGIRKTIGRYYTFEEAVDAHEKATTQMHGDYARW